MGAAGLVEIKRRLKSVQSTKKITNAMGLVATSKLRKCRKELRGNDEYVKVAEDTIKSICSNIDEDYSIPYFDGNRSEKKLYIVITSDSGLCAGYNNNVISYLTNLVKDNKENSVVIAVGNKGTSAIKRLGLQTIAEFVDIPDVPTITEVRTIYETALETFLKEEVSEVNVVYTHFISPIKQEVKVEKLLPISSVDKEETQQLIEPDLESVLTDSLDIYAKGTLRNLMLSSKCSEQSSRKSAMDSATSTANDIIDDLNLKYNRIRQAAITNEISEIVSGAETQK